LRRESIGAYREGIFEAKIEAGKIPAWRERARSSFAWKAAGGNRLKLVQS
jgi:hypothetical protein